MENIKQWEFVKQLRKYGETELSYLKEVLDKGAMSIFEVENGMVERFESRLYGYLGGRSKG